MTDFEVQGFIPLKVQWFHILLSLAGGEQHGYLRPMPGMVMAAASQFDSGTRFPLA